jgi:hypothetical protein
MQGYRRSAGVDQNSLRTLSLSEEILLCLQLEDSSLHFDNQPLQVADVRCLRIGAVGSRAESSHRRRGSEHESFYILLSSISVLGERAQSLSGASEYPQGEAPANLGDRS